MSGKFTFSTFCTTFLMVSLLLSISVEAQIRIISPVTRAVYQREIANKTTFTITGTYSQPIDKVEVRAIPVEAGQGIALDWTTLQTNPTGGVFSGNCTLQGGWYSLEVRGTYKGGTPINDVVSRMGVGEVFLISGQSNAQGLSREQNSPAAADDRVNYLVYDNNVNSLQDPPLPSFAHVERNSNIGPRGQTAWCWGALGDLLAKKLNVPIMFLNSAWEGTSIANWSESAARKVTYNSYGGFPYPAVMPYGNLLISVQFYASMYGARSILWMNGETDNSPLHTSKTDYQNRLQALINSLSAETNKRLTMVIARTSRTSTNELPSGSITNQDIIDGQNAVLAVPFNPVYPGPETDNLGNPRLDGIHFLGQSALNQLAEAWNTSLGTQFFATVTPLTPTLSPALSVTCGTDNNNLVLTAPDGYNSYSWSNGQTGKSITITSAGTYRATLKDANGNAVYSPTLVVSGSVKPTTPGITVGECPGDAGVLLTASGGNNLFTWTTPAGSTTTTTPQFRAEKKGAYIVKSQNVYGCTSDNSSSLELPFDAPLKATITPSGPFSLMATLSATGTNESFDWRSGTTDLESHSNIVRVVEKASYSVRGKGNYTIGNSTVACITAYSEPTDYATKDSDAIVIYPNPISDNQIKIEFRDNLQNAEVFFYKVDGSLLLSKKTDVQNGRITVPATGLASGIYIVKVKAEGIDVSKKVVIY